MGPKVRRKAPNWNKRLEVDPTVQELEKFAVRLGVRCRGLDPESFGRIAAKDEIRTSPCLANLLASSYDFGMRLMTLIQLALFFTLANLFTPSQIFAYTCYGDDAMCNAIAPSEGCAVGWCSSSSMGICIFDGCPR